MAFQSEIELRVKVLDKELKDLEKRIERVANPFSASGAAKNRGVQAAKTELQVERNRLKLAQDLNVERVKTLNLNSNWIRALREMKEIQEDIVTSVEKENKTRAKTQKQKSNQLTKGLLEGVGFPFLFGGGPGAVVGGGVGGILGAAKGFGFGAQALGTALGTAVDNFVAGAAEVGQALNLLTADTQKLLEASGSTGTKFAENVKAIEDLGFKTAALELAARRMATTIGSDGVNALEDFGKDSKRLGDEFSRAMLQMQTAVASVVNSVGILKAAAGGLERFVLRRQIYETLGSVTRPSQTPEAKRLRATLGPRDINTGYGELTAATYATQRKINAEKDALLNKEADNIIELKTNLEKTKTALDRAQSLQSAQKVVDKYANRQEEQARQQRKLDEDRAKIINTQEKAIGDLRLKLERQIQDLRLEGIRAENSLLDAQASNRIKQIQNQNAERARLLDQELALSGTPAFESSGLQSIDRARALLSEQEVSNEERKAKIKRDAALSAQQTELRTERFKLDTARQVASINERAADQIAALRTRVEELNNKNTAERYKAEAEMAAMRLNVIAAENELLSARIRDQLAGEQDPVKRLQLIDQQTDVDNYTRAIKAARDQLINDGIFAQPPAALTKPLAAPSVGGVDTQGAVDLANQILETEKNITAEKLTQVDLTTEAGRTQAAKLVDEATAPLLKAANAELERMNVTSLSTSEKLQRQADIVKDSIIPKLKEVRDQAGAPGSTPYEFWDQRIQDANKALEQTGVVLDQIDAKARELELKALLQDIADTSARAIGDALSQGIEAAITGAEKLEDVLANIASTLLKDIGMMLIRAGIGSVGGGGLLGSIFKASGGPVMANRPYVVGERGPELFLPHQSGYIQSNTATRASLPQNTQPRTIRFETTMINNVEYVTKEEAIAIGRQAADDGARRGAKMGVSQTMSGLQNSRSQRAKLGMR